MKKDLKRKKTYRLKTGVFKHDAEEWEGCPSVEGFIITAKDPRDLDKANKLNQIYSIFESETRYLLT